MTRYTAAAVFLTILGLAQMAADLTGVLPLKGLAAATNASPAPKVFSSVRGLETYSTRFFLEWPGQSLELTPQVYSRIRGPYNRRNVYGAALAYAPVLPAELRDPVMRYALCGERRLLGELGVDSSTVRDPIAVRLEPVEGSTLDPTLGTRFEAPCR